MVPGSPIGRPCRRKGEFLVNSKKSNNLKSDQQPQARKIATWEQRRQDMKGVCLNCHSATYVDKFYQQYDDVVVLYNDKFARPAQRLMNDLQTDGALNPKAPFEH